MPPKRTSAPTLPCTPVNERERTGSVAREKLSSTTSPASGPARRREPVTPLEREIEWQRGPTRQDLSSHAVVRHGAQRGDPVAIAERHVHIGCAHPVEARRSHSARPSIVGIARVPCTSALADTIPSASVSRCSVRSSVAMRTPSASRLRKIGPLSGI